MRAIPPTTWACAVAGTGLLCSWAREGLGLLLSRGPDNSGIRDVSVAGSGGSELPWWSPLAVSGILLVFAAVERGRRRRRGRTPPNVPEQLALWDGSGRPWWTIPSSTPGDSPPGSQGALTIRPAFHSPPA